MGAMQDYRALVAETTLRCKTILDRYADQIVCARGCRGNCCRIHLSVFAVEAFHLATALKSHPVAKVRKIRNRAIQSAPAGPCPLLEGAACELYSDRLILCRTHGLPMRTRYRGHTAVGCCPKNFNQAAGIPADACIDLDQLNMKLARINDRFLVEHGGRRDLKTRYSISEALTDILKERSP